VLLEHLLVGTWRRRQLTVHKPRHDLAQDRGVIFRLGLTFGPFDAESSEMRAQPRQRPLVQKSRKIIRPVGQEFPSPKSDEKVKIFAFDTLDAGPAGGFGKHRMGNAKRTWIAGQIGQVFEQGSIRCACEQHRQQRIFPPPRSIDLVDVAR
jgi:hypothetical protein